MCYEINNKIIKQNNKIIRINKPKTYQNQMKAKPISCDCKFKFSGRKCN